ncbi:MAG TPA: hypothetical protein VKU19_03630 [Bryobacteraceae bacterium]|nr:hypothetical protein [Bryobacteraceae bacterium]
MTTRRNFVRWIGAAATAQAWGDAKKPIIRTVLKDLPPEALAGGAILFHEHMSLDPDFMPKWIARARSMPLPPPSTQPYFMRDPELMAGEMAAAAKDGVACIVDQGHPDMGRDLEFLKQISQASGMPIVAACGYYAQPFYPPEIAKWSESQIAHELIREAKTLPIGVIGEIGTWDVMTADERKVFRAVAKTHLATNLAIVTHTNFGKGALEQLDLLQSAGVKPERVAIGHVGGLNEPTFETVKAIAQRGAYVGIDRQGGPGDVAQVRMVLALLQAGYVDRLLFSSDFSLGGPLLKRNGGSGYAKTLTVFVPKLREAGVGEDILHRILVDNPRRLLAFVPKH